jgi:adenylate cyclase class IV
MPRNIEIKAHIASVEALARKASAIADQGPIEIIQDDTFFVCEAGRLKLRAFSKEQGELIFYRRTNQQGPKESFYLRSPTSAPDTLRESLSLAYGQAGRVLKHRTLFLVGRTHVHLDRVAHLGDFLELEVVLEGDEPSEAGVREAHELMAKLGVEPSQLIEGAYVDLLANNASNSSIERTSHRQAGVYRSCHADEKHQNENADDCSLFHE